MSCRIGPRTRSLTWCSLNKFANSQFAVLSLVNHHMPNDDQALAEWGNNYQTQASRLAMENPLGLLFK